MKQSYIYVALFDNGLIKIGQSNNVAARIKQHSERIVVAGITLSSHRSYKCNGDVNTTEGAALSKCRKKASKVIKKEWFFGVDFNDACLIAESEAEFPHKKTIAPKVIKEPSLNATESEKIIDALGGTATLAKDIGVGRPTIQAWKRRQIPYKYLLSHQRLFSKGHRLAKLPRDSHLGLLLSAYSMPDIKRNKKTSPASS